MKMQGPDRAFWPVIYQNFHRKCETIQKKGRKEGKSSQRKLETDQGLTPVGATMQAPRRQVRGQTGTCGATWLRQQSTPGRLPWKLLAYGPQASLVQAHSLGAGAQGCPWLRERNLRS